MKKCLQCGRVYDTSMSFCVDDGDPAGSGTAGLGERKDLIERRGS